MLLFGHWSVSMENVISAIGSSVIAHKENSAFPWILEVALTTQRKILVLWGNKGCVTVRKAYSGFCGILRLQEGERANSAF